MGAYLYIFVLQASLSLAVNAPVLFITSNSSVLTAAGTGKPLNWMFYGPLIMALLLRYVSGVALLERKQSKHPEFAQYASETNAFIPWCPSAADDDFKEA